MPPDRSQRPECIECPGCRRPVFPNAPECPNCGYQPATRRTDDLLGGLVTVSSILVGFGLAALVEVATSEIRGAALVQAVSGLWIAASVILLGVLIGAEVLRRREPPRPRLLTTSEDDDRLWARCEALLWAFVVALLATAAGVVVLAFFFSTTHGVLGCGVAAVMLLLLSRLLRL